MYIGSPSFQAANSKAVQKHRIRGTIDNIPFTTNNILAGSFNLANQCSEESDFKIGSVYVGQMSATFLNNLAVTPTSWKNRIITVYFGLCIDELNNIWEEFQVGVYYVSEAEINADGVSVTCYDVMSKLDKKLPTDYLASGSIGDITRAICNTCNVPFTMTDPQIAALPNGTHTFGSYTPNDCETYRDLIFWLSNTVGGFATIDRFGHLVYRTYDDRDAAELSIGANKRVSGASFSDFTVEFESIVFDNADGTSERYGNMSGGAIYYNGFSPFLEFGTIDERRTIRQNVADVVRGIEYTPFTVELMSAPIFELGDVLEFTGGILNGNPKKGIVQSISWTLNQGLTICGYGADPAIQDTLSTQEQSSAAQRKAEQNSEIVYRDYINMVPISVSADPVKVCDIYFTSTKETDVEMWHEIQLQTIRTPGNESMTVEAVYYMDGAEMIRHPIETYDDDAYHLLDLHYFTNVSIVGSHRWEVFLQADGGIANIRANDSIAVLKGQGLSKADGWTGIIVIEDEIIPPKMSMNVPQLTDAVSVSLIIPHIVEVSDTVRPPKMSMNVGSYADTVEVKMFVPLIDITSEDHEYNITDESGDFDISNEY